MRFFSVIVSIALLGPCVVARADSPIPPEDLILSDRLAPVGATAHPFLHSSFIAGDDGFWSAELEAGVDFPSGWQVSMLGARSQVGSAATNEIWANANTLVGPSSLLGLSAMYGDGPSPQKYFGGVLNGVTRLDDWRVKLQSGAVGFRGTVTTVQVPVRAELGYAVNRDLVLAVGGAYYFYSASRARLATVLGATTLQAGSGILSGFPLDQFYVKIEAGLSETVQGSLALSSAATPYQTERVLGLQAKAHYALGREYALGLELSLSRGSASDYNFAVGPSLRCYW